MAFAIFGTPNPTFFTNSAAFAAGGQLTIRDPSTNALKNTYPTADDADAGTNANANPITLDSRGQAEIWGVEGETYKYVLRDADGVTLESSDNLNVDFATQFYLPSHTGASLRALSDRLDERASVKDFGAVGDGVTDDSTAIQAALDSGEAHIYFPPGTYLCTSNFTVSSGTTISGDGATLDFSTKSSRAQCFRCIGTVSAYTALTADATAGDTTLTVANASAYTAGDMLLLRSSAKFNDTMANATGEICYVESASGTTITLQEKLRFGYATGDTAAIAVVTPVTDITIRGLKFIGTKFQHPTGAGDTWQNGDGDHGITVQYGRNVTIENCTFTDVVRMAVRIVSSDKWMVHNCNIDMPQEQDTTQIIYGICWIDYSSNGRILGNRIYRGRHGIVNSDSSGYGLGHSVTVSGNTIEGTYVAAMSTHSSGWDTVWSSNITRNCQTGIDLRTPRHTVAGNSFLAGNYSVSGRGATFRETAADIVFSGNLFEDWRFACQIESTTIGDDYNCANVHWAGNSFTGCTTGLDCEYTGGQNTDGTYRTQVFTNWSFVGNHFSGIGTRGIELQGYFDHCNISNNTFMHVDGTENYGVWMGGVQKCVVSNNTFYNSYGILEGNHNVTNASGVTVARTPANNVVRGNTSFDHNTSFELYNGFVATDRYLGDNIIVGRDSLTIASGAITVSNPFVTVDTESGVASDDIDTITANGPGQVVTIRAANDARTVRLVDGSGNLDLAGNISLDNTQDTATLIYDGDSETWKELSESNNGA